jgi:putative endonuclease
LSDRYSFIAVYMMSSRPFGPLYTGVTSNLIKRAYEHRQGLTPGFTKTYGLKMLVWYEQHETMDVALQREKSLKRYRRVWKVNLIEQFNPDWADLYPTLVG